MIDQGERKCIFPFFLFKSVHFFRNIINRRVCIKQTYYYIYISAKLEILFVIKKDWGRGFKAGFENLNTPPPYKKKNRVQIR